LLRVTPLFIVEIVVPFTTTGEKGVVIKHFRRYCA
jgi:hypothetical protein